MCCGIVEAPFSLDEGTSLLVYWRALLPVRTLCFMSWKALLCHGVKEGTVSSSTLCVSFSEGAC